MQGKENTNPNHPYLFTNARLNKELKGSEYSKDRPSCARHGEEVGRLFCQDCLVYNLCSKCSPDHQGHNVRKFQNWSQAKEETKEVLLTEVESTLNRLKGRDNELKNQIQEISLIKQRLKTLSDEVINTIKSQLQQLQQRVHQKLKNQFEKYQRELDSFYREYNSVNDHLRQNLLQIIDGEIDLQTFSKDNVSRDIDVSLMPQFGKMKMQMQKCKKYLRNVKESTKELQNSIKFFSNEQQKTHIKYQKYDKFLKEKTYTQESNMPLLRTLHMLENHQPDLSLIRQKMRT